MASWTYLGIFIVAYWGIVAYASQNSPWAGVVLAGVMAMAVLVALAVWQRAQARYFVPAAEYLAVVWLIGYIGLATMDAIAAGELPSGDWLFLLPPLSAVPLGLRVVLGDDGTPGGRARRVAEYAHQVIGVLLCGLALVLIVSVLLILAAPLPLVPGIMHLRAGHLYRTKRRPKRPVDPRRGFLD